MCLTIQRDAGGKCSHAKPLLFELDCPVQYQKGKGQMMCLNRGDSEQGGVMRPLQSPMVPTAISSIEKQSVPLCGALGGCAWPVARFLSFSPSSVLSGQLIKLGERRLFAMSLSRKKSSEHWSGKGKLASQLTRYPAIYPAESSFVPHSLNAS